MGKRITDLLDWIAHRELAFLAIVSPLLLLPELDRRLAMAALLVVVLLGWLTACHGEDLPLGRKSMFPLPSWPSYCWSACLCPPTGA